MLFKSSVAVLTVLLCASACGGGNSGPESTASVPAAQRGTPSVSFTVADLDQFERGLAKEIEAVKAAQKRVAEATTAQARGEAIQAQFETATARLGAEAAGLPEARYGEIREHVDKVLTTLDFQDKIPGPMSIDLSRADDETKKRVAGDAFAELPPDAAAALRSRMDRLVPLWIEYKKLVAVAG